MGQPPVPVQVIESPLKGGWGYQRDLKVGPFLVAMPGGPPPPFVPAPVPAETVLGPVELCELQSPEPEGQLLTATLSGPAAAWWASALLPEVELVALVEWGAVGAARVCAAVDIRDGAVIEVFARTLRILGYARVYAAGILPAYPPVPAPAPGTLIPSISVTCAVGAFVGRGARGKSSARRTVHSEAGVAVGAFGTVFPLTGVPDSTPQTLFLPPPAPPAPAAPPIWNLWRTVSFARRCRLNVQPEGSAVRLVFFGTGLGPPFLQTRIYPAFPTDWIDIPNGAIGWCLQNVGGAAITRYEMLYDLDL